ncbi:MAG TPA: hypothetical protein VFA03_00220 [Acetobacteraceae bacterium]|nr:hypothetical protein [Acetobacteraceae bacterium]
MYALGLLTDWHYDRLFIEMSERGFVAHGLFGLSLADGLKTRSDDRFVPSMLRPP